MPNPITIRLAWPSPGETEFRSDFFVGAWSPIHDLQVECRASNGAKVRSIASQKWFLASEASPLHDSSRGLVNAAEPGAPISAVAFRGYLLDAALHGWCEPAAILKYWANPPASYNGMFAAVRILPGDELEFTSGAFGIAPLYYRIWNGVVLFSTDPHLLGADGDTLDPLAGRALLQAGYIFGDRSLTSGVRRVPPGSRLRFKGSTTPAQESWFRYDGLRQGDRPIDDAAVGQVEECFQAAMDRCLRLQASRVILPLSSGYDSRRILAALDSRQVAFEALTVRIIQKGDRDLDARWAAAMAKDFGFPHRVIELAEPRQYAADDHLVRTLADAHVTEHAWMMPVMRGLPQESSLVFDGLGGDIFNNTGYAIPELYTCPESEKLLLIAKQHLAPADVDRNLNGAWWPGIQELREYFVDYLAKLPEGRIRADLAFLLLRARQGTGVWSQAMVPAGHIPVHPYFDIDYVRLALEYDPLHKIERFLQDRCLAKFWPQYYSYPGSRRIPFSSRPGSPATMNRIRMACLRQLYSEAGTKPLYGELRPWLSPRGYALLLAAAHNDVIATRVNWWMYRLLSLKARDRWAVACWSVPPG